MTERHPPGADMLQELDATLTEQGIELKFAELQDPVRKKIERYELSGALGPGRYYPTVHAAEDAFRAQVGEDA